ncbi:MAG: PAS domain S-box protein [Gammaproteobacteria bacterium]|nr:PAS domain S-box protein [Gammaproteobacteria bacterium]
MKWGLTQKATALMLGALMLMASALIGLFYFISLKSIEVELKSQLALTTNVETNRLYGQIEHLKKDALVLASLGELKQYAKRDSSSSTQSYDQNRSVIISIFSSLIKEKRDYYQIRFVDLNGIERIKLQRDDESVRVIDEQFLQDKSSKDYVQNGLKLKPSKIYISNISLNREFGKIQKPQIPVIRIVAPIYSDDNEKLGLVIINYNMYKTLTGLKFDLYANRVNLFITNQYGDYLEHPDLTKSFGFEYGRRYTLQDDFPFLESLFTSSVKKSTSIVSYENERFISAYQRVVLEREQPDNYVVIGLLSPYEVLIENQIKNLNRHILIAFTLTLLLLSLAYIWFKRTFQPIGQIVEDINAYRMGGDIGQLPEQRGDEIGVLARAFRELSSRIDESHYKLTLLNEDLESQVQSRTSDLNESRKMLQYVLDTIPARVFWKDIDGNYLGCNQLFANDAGLESPNLIVGKSDYDMPWKEQAESFRADDKRVIDSHQPLLHIEEPQSRPNGSVNWLETSKVPLVDANDNTIGILGTYHDITQRREAELALSQFKSTLDQTMDCVFMFDADELKFTYFNQGALNQVGYTEAEMYDMHPYDIKPLYSQEEFENMIAPMLAGKQNVVNFETIHQHKNGELIPVEIMLQYIHGENELPRFVALVRDITERKKIENMKSQFISTVSHELRTPLTSIRGAISLIRGGVVEGLPDNLKTMLDIAGNNTERLLLLINDILDMQKIESGEMAFRFRNVSLLPILQHAIDDNAGYASQHNVTFKLEHTVDTNVYVDPDRIAQVMNNLMSNAAKFSPDGEEVNISAASHGNVVRISVSDHGPGIPEQYHETIFEQFTQAENVMTKSIKGTGLGLSITKAIVEKHGGRIDFISGEGAGTTFYFDLPLQEERPNTEEGMPRLLDSNHQPCMLIVEDEPDIAILLQRMLAHDGINADIAHTAKEARQLLGERAEQYIAMTLDIRLPDDNGIHLLEEVNRNKSTRHIKVIIVSVEADELKRRLHGSAMKVEDWISKPIDETRLTYVITKLGQQVDLPSVLHVEDDDSVSSVVRGMIGKDVNLAQVATLEDARLQLHNKTFDLLLLDIGLPDGSGLELLNDLDSQEIPPHVVIFSAYDVSDEMANKVDEVLTKSKTDNETLQVTIRKLLQT